MTVSVYIDTNAFIAHSTGAQSEGVRRVFDAAAGGEIACITSEMTLAELLPKPLQRGQHDLVKAYTDLVSGTGMIKTVPVTRDILVRTAKLRAQSAALKLPDAIHVATAIFGDCSAVLSGDRRLPALADAPLVLLSPSSLTEIRRIVP